jgi:pyruvate,water dikinase
MLVPLAAATADLCGGKAGALGALIRAGLPVPEGIVVPFTAYDAIACPFPKVLADDLGRWLDSIGDPAVAVRSSAANEDTAAASAAGQHDSFLGVQGVAAVAAAVRACWASLWSPRAIAYREASGGEASMAVIVQRHVDSEVSGVMFTPVDGTASTVIEASWGLGPSVVEGRVTPDRYRVAADGSVTSTIADKPTSLDRHGSHDVPASWRRRATLTDATAVRLAQLGQEVTAVLGDAQDIEWAIAAGRPWLLQSRPISAPPPPSSSHIGVPASHGTATGPARIVRGPADFDQVRPGDILVCRFTDPAWTPLFGIAAGIVTEIGGVLSHAAIVARERGIPAIVAVPNATTHFESPRRVWRLHLLEG